METLSVLLAICAGNSPVIGEFPTQMPVTGSFNIFFDLRLNKRLSKNGEAGDLRRYFAHYDVPAMSHSKSKQDRVKATNFKKLPKIKYLEIKKKSFIRTTHLLKLFDAMYESEMKWIRLVLCKLQGRDNYVYRWTDRRIRWNQYTLLQLRWAGDTLIYFFYISDTYNKSIISYFSIHLALVTAEKCCASYGEGLILWGYALTCWG